MRKILALAIFVTFGLFLATRVSAMRISDYQDVAVQKANPSGQRIIRVPDNAVELASGVFSLGETVDINGKAVEGIMVYHHRPGHSGGPGGGDPTPTASPTSSCYAYLSKNTKWKSVEPYNVDTANSAGLSPAEVQSVIANAVAKWENAAGKDIIGDQDSSIVIDGADTVSPDGHNEVMFGDIGEPGAIGVTIVWGVFGGPPFARELVEWDQVYDDVDFDWSLTGEAGKMDFDNIVNHEHGHAFGMAHPSDSCTEETMFRFASEGETKKRDLNTGDIAGVQNLYN